MVNINICKWIFFVINFFINEVKNKLKVLLKISQRNYIFD